MSFRRCLYAGFVLVLASGCSLDLYSRDRYLNFDFDGLTANVSVKSEHAAIDLTPYVGARTNLEYVVHFSNRRQGTIYALLEASGQAGPTAGELAAGTEQSLVWLKLDPDLKPLEIRSVLVESGVHGIHSVNGCQVEDQLLAVRYAANALATTASGVESRQTHYLLRYDNDQPEKGMVVTTNPGY